MAAPRQQRRLRLPWQVRNDAGAPGSADVSSSRKQQTGCAQRFATKRSGATQLGALYIPEARRASRKTVLPVDHACGTGGPPSRLVTTRAVQTMYCPRTGTRACTGRSATDCGTQQPAHATVCGIISHQLISAWVQCSHTVWLVADKSRWWRVHKATAAVSCLR